MGEACDAEDSLCWLSLGEKFISLNSNRLAGPTKHVINISIKHPIYARPSMCDANATVSYVDSPSDPVRRSKVKLRLFERSSVDKTNDALVFCRTEPILKFETS